MAYVLHDMRFLCYRETERAVPKELDEVGDRAAAPVGS